LVDIVNYASYICFQFITNLKSLKLKAGTNAKMSKGTISDLNRALIEIVWHFGPKGLDGECCENLSMPEFLALDKIANTQDCRVQKIGQLLGFTKSGATRIVNRLEKNGYVQKIKSYEDARVCCVLITQQGENVLNSTDERYSKELEQLLSRMPEKNVPQMKELLKGMAKALRD